MSVTEDDLRVLEEFEQRGYHNGGFKIYDVSNPAQPKLICYQKTGGIGVHRFDMDERYAYISTEMKGYVGNILVIYDLRDPRAAAGSLALVDDRAARRGRRDADLVRPAAPAAPRAALRQRDVGELLARRLLGRRRVRPRRGREAPAATTTIRCFRSRPTR